MENSLASSPNVHDFPFFGNKNEFAPNSMTEMEWAQEKRNWQDSVRARLLAIMRLTADWDGYGADSPPYDTVLFTNQILNDIWRHDLPVPDLSPMSSEGIMNEWITRDYEFTLEINGPNEMTFIFENLQTGTADEGPIARDLRTLDQYFRLIVASSEPAGAVA